MLRYLAYLIGFFAIIAVASAQKQTPSGEQPASQAPLDPHVATTLFWVIGVGLIGGLATWLISRLAHGDTSGSRAKDDKDLEAMRINLGFWLVISALFFTLSVLVVILTAFAPDTPKTTDIVAIISAVIGVIGTLTTAFFGIQAASAGRSQALTAMAELKSPGPNGATTAYKVEPSCGPHSGGTKISISGNGLTGANGVNFGATPGTNFVCENDGLVRANSPPAPEGVNEAKVVVVFPGASPVNREVGTFYYYTIEDVDAAADGRPPPHPKSGGNKVKIRGSGLQAVNAVEFGTEAATGFKASPDGLTDIIVPSAPSNLAETAVNVTVLFPVDSPTNSFVVGKYRYD